MPSFATVSPELPNNVPATVLSVFSVDTTSSSMVKVLSCIAGKSAQKVGTILPFSYHPLYPLRETDISPKLDMTGGRDQWLKGSKVVRELNKINVHFFGKRCTLWQWHINISGGKMTYSFHSRSALLLYTLYTSVTVCYELPLTDVLSIKGNNNVIFHI